ncbi:MAG: molybdate ABC transporter permease subunit [Gammaproteobacteria bacterium]|nr:molybdate ABC transporter permease subunit [Gammaproteobacteria bacterium]MYH32999.1 molybdate ABC transporter permease subunit [Gammaproteobacteria bacterium]MYL00471.1 molybdate ABC transporter permease subunit [Gammaproteobacteria bacterium]
MTPVWEIAALSLKVSLWAVACSLPVGIACAWVLARCRFPGKILLDGLVHLPLVTPPVVVGYLLLIVLGRNGWLGRLFHDWFGVTFTFTWKGAAVAAAVMAFPLMVRAIRLGIESVDRRLEEAARTLGATPARSLFTVTLPLAAPGLLTGALLAFARCLGEFGATITFVSNVPGQTRTLPLAIYTLLQTPEGETAAAWLAGVSLALAVVALAASELAARAVRRRLH